MFEMVLGLALWVLKLVVRALWWALVAGPSSVWSLLEARPFRREVPWRRFLWALLPWLLTTVAILIGHLALSTRVGRAAGDHLFTWCALLGNWMSARPDVWFAGGPAILFRVFVWRLAGLIAVVFVLSTVYGGPFWVAIHWVRRCVEGGTRSRVEERDLQNSSASGNVVHG